MKLICTRENFKTAIFNSERVVSKQSTLPILNNILFETEKGGLRLSATNLEMGVEVRVGAKVEKEGKITIPAKLISNFINNLPVKGAEDNIFLELVEQGMKIKTGSTRAIIKGLPANDFPLIPKKNTEFALKISAKKIKETIAQLVSCVAPNETRQELTGINVILNEEEVYFAATDSFRLAEKRVELEDNNKNKEMYTSLIRKKNNIIIPANTIIELSRIVSGEETDFVEITIEENQVFFDVNNTNLISRLINRKYPEYKHILPREFKTRAVMEKETLQGAVKIASFFSPGKSSEIKLKIDAQKKKATTETISVELGENATESDLEVTGPSQEIIFNSRYFLDGINTISSSKVAILINSNTSPVALKEIDEKTGKVLDDFTYIVMPIKN
ncbi:MAG: DNA polymerase III subunit beta [Candidatus Moranbacteria bacterium RBG_19FT_COMBO_42_6]|nr:MAG: DNA polymerase III subunit beta [Candidatus Moranbacteria bacterium RBG_19FT_COMBO_42_6]